MDWGLRVQAAPVSSEYLVSPLTIAAVLSGHSPQMKKATATEGKVGTSLRSPPHSVVVESKFI